MQKHKIIVHISFALLFFLIQIALGVGVPAYSIISNKAFTFANNYLGTNAYYTNLISAEIHGILENSTNTNITYAYPEQTNYFAFFVTNRANITETNLYIGLSNFKTNTNYMAGNWLIGIADNNSNLMATNWTHPSFSSINFKVTNHIFVDTVYQFFLVMAPPSNVDPNSWASVDMRIFVQTNSLVQVSSYTSGGILYGGETNIYKTCKTIMSAPNLTLHKSVEFITNTFYGNYSAMPGCEITYRIAFSNSGHSAGKDVKVIDVLPSQFVMLTNYFIVSNYSTNFLSDIRFSDDNGASWLYSPSATWDSNVTQIRFFATNIIPVSGTGIIKYKIKIK